MIVIIGVCCIILMSHNYNVCRSSMKLDHYFNFEISHHDNCCSVLSFFDIMRLH